MYTVEIGIVANLSYRNEDYDNFAFSTKILFAFIIPAALPIEAF